MLNEGVADLCARADQNTDYSSRYACFFKNTSAEKTTSHGCIARRLDDDCVTQSQCRCYRALCQVEWEIPRADYADNAQWFAVNAVLFAWNIGGQNAAMDTCRERSRFQGDATRSPIQFEL